MPKDLKPVGRCIYCMRATGDLTDEHIIPESLNGTLVLPEASCSDCALITSKFERIVARQMYGRLRMRLDFRSKRKKERPATQPIMFETHVSAYAREIPVQSLPRYYAAARLPLPGILMGEPPSKLTPAFEIDLKGDEADLASLLARERQALRIRLNSEWHWGAFSRLLAKIGHAYTVAWVGLEGWQPLLPPMILGEDECLSYLTGGVRDRSEECQPPNDLMLVTAQAESEILLSVRMSLLGFGRLPTYQAVSGRVTDWATISERTARSSMMSS